MLIVQPKIRLCDLFGIPIYLDFSLIFLLLFFTLGGGSVAAGFLCAFLLLLSITLHELGHALTARVFGYPTRDITLSLLGGCASLIALPRKAWQEFLTALAGPAVSFLLAGLGVAGIAMLMQEGSVVSYLYHDFLNHFRGLVLTDGKSLFFMQGESLVFKCAKSSQLTLELLSYVTYMNLLLGLFNLLPGFPLDGGRIFRSAMSPFLSRVRATYVAMIVGRVVAVLLGLRGLYNFVNGANWGMVTMLIAWMIWREGWREYQMVRVETFWERGNFRAHASPPPYGGDDQEGDLGRGWPRR